MKKPFDNGLASLETLVNEGQKRPVGADCDKNLIAFLMAGSAFQAGLRLVAAFVVVLFCSAGCGARIAILIVGGLRKPVNT